MEVVGKSVKYGDDINTDAIIPGKYLTSTDPHELAKHAMEGIDTRFVGKYKEGVIIVAGKNFGCGSSREQAPIALKYAGVGCIIAKSFARIFYRNSINIGLPVLECSSCWESVQDGDVLKVDIRNGQISNTTKNITVFAQPLPEFILKLVENGGLLNKLKRDLSK